MDVLPTFNATMTAIGAALVELCQATDGIDAIKVYADVSDDEPYSRVAAYDSEGREVIGFHRFWGGEGE